jgi:hypothetical protein
MSETPSFPKPTLDEDQIAAIRAYHRRTREAGLIACLVGVAVMVAGRFMPGAPIWLVSVGVGIAVFGWGLIAYALMRRVAMARSLAAKAKG